MKPEMYLVKYIPSLKGETYVGKIVIKIKKLLCTEIWSFLSSYSMKQKVINILMLLLIGGLYGLYYMDYQEEHKEPEKVDVLRLEQPEFLLSEAPDDYLMEALEYYNVEHKNIVYAQAILETGHFRSKVCKEYNNLFGLYNSYKGDYYKFDHWSESVVAYLNYIQYRYKPPDDYYQFLIKIGYAEDPQYVEKLKNIVKRYG